MEDKFRRLLHRPRKESKHSENRTSDTAPSQHASTGSADVDSLGVPKDKTGSTSRPVSRSSPSATEQQVPVAAESHGSVDDVDPSESVEPGEEALSTDPQALWNQAYDKFRRKEPKLTKHYESLLEKEFGTEKTKIATQQSDVRAHMDELLRVGLDKTAKSAKVQEKIGEVAGVILSVKEVVGSALQAAPVAAVAWTGVCLALQVSTAPIEEMKANRDGIVKITRKMKWYSSLSEVLLHDDTRADAKLMELELRLASVIRELYETLIQYIVKSVCAYNRRTIQNVLRDAFQLDDWKGGLESVENAEAEVMKAADQYGVREANSYLALLVNRQFDDSQNQVMRQLSVTDVDIEMGQLEDRKGSVLPDSYQWVRECQEYRDFTDWHTQSGPQILWLKGDPGSGKTMLTLGLVNELRRQQNERFNEPNLSYFFCQGTDERLDTAIATLKSLIWMLLRQNRSLIGYVQERYSILNADALPDSVLFGTLSEAFLNMLQDSSLHRVLFVVDALDECKEAGSGRDKLLKLIQISTERSEKIKWLISSRKLARIDDALVAESNGRTCVIEVTPDATAKSIEAYIANRIGAFRERLKPGTKTPRRAVQEKLRQYDENFNRIEATLHQKARGNFLWVQLVCERLETCKPEKMLERVQETPEDLSEVYQHMVDRMLEFNHADEAQADDFRRVMMATLLAKRPLVIDELALLADLEEENDLQKKVEDYGFLTVRECVVQILHQTVRDFFLEGNISAVFPEGLEEGHSMILERSLLGMDDILERDIYGLGRSDCLTKDVKIPSPDPLAPIRYSCRFWVDHLYDATYEKSSFAAFDDGDGEGEIGRFLRSHYLHWLEALSLMASPSGGVQTMENLKDLIAEKSPGTKLLELVDDMRRFAWHAQDGIKEAPLQAYTSALVFSPTDCITRQLFATEDIDFHVKIGLPRRWDACLQTIRLPTRSRDHKMVFSPDGSKLVLDDTPSSLQIWDLETRSLLQTFKEDWLHAVYFSPDGTKLVASSRGGLIRIWHVTSGREIDTLLGHTGFDSKPILCFSPDGSKLASGDFMSIKIWNLVDGIEIATLRGIKEAPCAMSFSSDGCTLACITQHAEGKLWDAKSGEETFSFDYSDILGNVEILPFLPDGNRITTQSHGYEIKFRDIMTGEEVLALEEHTDNLGSMSFSPDGARLATGSADGSIKVWNATNGKELCTFEGHTSEVSALRFSSDSATLLSACGEAMVNNWALSHLSHDKTDERGHHASPVTSVVFSPDGSQLASGSRDQAVKVWDMNSATQKPLRIATRPLHSDYKDLIVTPEMKLAFSSNGTKLITGGVRAVIVIWDSSNGRRLAVFKGYDHEIRTILCPPDGKLIVNFMDGTLAVCRIDEGNNIEESYCVDNNWPIYTVAFSPDGKLLATGDERGLVTVWRVALRAAFLLYDLANPAVYDTGMEYRSKDDTLAVSISLDSSKVRSRTTDGVTVWDMKSGGRLKPVDEEFQADYYVKDSWLYKDSVPLLWIPPSYKPNRSLVASSGRKVAWGCDSGKVVMLEV